MWSKVTSACCIHDTKGWTLILMVVATTLFFLYFFPFALGTATGVLSLWTGHQGRCSR